MDGGGESAEPHREVRRLGRYGRGRGECRTTQRIETAGTLWTGEGEHSENLDGWDVMDGGGESTTILEFGWIGRSQG